jgi:hypothetical protein
VLALLALTNGAYACKGPNVLYEDDFSMADPAWGNYTSQKIEGGKLTIAPEQYTGYALENQSSFFTDFDVCVDVVQKHNDPTTGYAGIVFWGVDYDNFYSLDVATNGFVRVSRKQNQRWLTPVAWTEIAGINPGTEVNQVRVTAKGNLATLYVNGTQAASFKGQPPQGGGLLGVYASSPKDSTGLFDFDNFKVTDVSADAATPPPPAAAPAPAPAPGTLSPGVPKTP